MNKLPPLPPSDAESIGKNTFNGFYKKGARDFWGDNALEEIELKGPIKCKHFFEQFGKEIRCNKCHIGWMSTEFRVEDGVLYVGEQQVNI
jgi:hypothetical protein